MKTNEDDMEKAANEGFAVIEYPGGYTIGKTATLFSLEKGKLTFHEVSGDEYNSYKFIHVCSFLFQHGVKLVAE